MARNMRTSIACTILVFCCLAISCGIAGHYVQSTKSMMPAIEVGDHLATFEIKSNSFNPIERFDIIVYKSQPTKENVGEVTYLVHRVICLPNETIEIKKGQVFINNQVLGETFEKVSGGIDFSATRIPENEYFLLGDNRPQSMDSRYWIKPTIKREDIRGKVTKIIRKAEYDNGKRW